MESKLSLRTSEVQRCLTKGPKWLCDLNRATIQTEMPAVLFLLYHLILKLAEQRGWKAVHVNNKFLQEQINQPPNVHLNLEMPGNWVRRPPRSVILEQSVDP